YKYAESHKDDVKISVKYKNILNETLVKADFACNMIVLKTYAGMANAAAAAVDNMGWDEIVGSIAGDDTVLIIMRSEESAKDFYDKFNELIRR
ncbi:MAG: arginine repressor, partial [Clostridia bacterium]|nr:arginine repressor [Clostridia bacterium]